MARWRPNNPGLLAPADVKSGELIKFIEEPYTTDKGFTNVKVSLPDGTHKLGTINDFSGDYLAAGWGEEMSGWVGRTAKVEIRESRASGKSYIVFTPTDEPRDMSVEESPLSPEQKAELERLHNNAVVAQNADAPADNPAEAIPF